MLLVLAACGGGGGGGTDGGTDGGDGGPAPTAATPPGQPASGPGGSTYPYADVVESVHGAGDTQYWIFEPASPGPGTHPLVVFLHGWNVLDVESYRGWLEHLARRGNVVVYPRYQTSALTLPTTFTGNAVAALRTALVELGSGGHAAVDPARAGVVGHSFGGVLAANLAAIAAAESLPTMRAVMCAEPGTAGFGVYEDYADVPSGTLLLAIAGEDDLVVGTTDARRIFLGTTAVPLADKDYVLLRTDEHGTPALRADHQAPGGGVVIGLDAFDWRGFWRWFDALLDAAFTGANRDVCLGNTAAQRDLGAWSDGVPVLEPVVTDTP
jgi:acetyl esterase/lipase